MTSLIDIRKAESYEAFTPGTWFRQAGVAPMICCGFCGTRTSLAEHTIAADGTVQPSLVCPTDCGWQVFARLVGWEE